jgi:hypothetical protein
LKIISGGQTGADRAALDAAMDSGFEVGGWCPRDRRAEDGVIPARYPLQETAARSYAVRTEWNVRDSDGTLILVLDEISSGTRLTAEAAKAHRKPLHIEHLAPMQHPGLLSSENSLEEKTDSVVEWIHRHKIHILNVAGPRGSSSNHIYSKARAFMDLMLSRLQLENTRATLASSSRRRRQ